jgi:hypothetical protein
VTTATALKCENTSFRKFATKHDNARFEPGIFFTKNNKTVVPIHSIRLTSLLANFRHFDTIEVIEAEPQEMLQILTEHDFQDALKNGKGRERCIRAEGGCFESGNQYAIINF